MTTVEDDGGMISFEQMPTDNADLANIDIDFPHLQPNDQNSCPVSLDYIVNYLRLESPDGESVQPSQLKFLRTALVSDRRYWIWFFLESDGSRCYVTVSESSDGSTSTGYEQDYYRLTPEQYLLGDYHQVF